MKTKIVIMLMITICLLGSIFSSAVKINQESYDSQNIDSNAIAAWTIMVYLDGDNNLEYSALDDFMEMSTVGSTADVNIVVQLDRVGGYDYSYGDWTTCKRFYVEQNMTPVAQNAMMDVGEANMGDPQTLIDFASWSMREFPAEQYCLILWDHGSGWKEDYESTRKDVCEDDTNYDSLKLYELKDALNSITSSGSFKIELLGFDACLMGGIEIAYEVRDSCRYMTASEDTEPVAGWNYEDSLAVLVSNPYSIDGEILGEIFVTYYTGYELTLSTINVETLDTLTDAISNLASSLMSNQYRSTVDTIFSGVKKYMETCDICHFALLVKENIFDYNVNDYADEVIFELQNTVTSEMHDYYEENSYGLSIYLPYWEYDSDYSYIDFSSNSLWDDFLIYMFEGSGDSNPPSEPRISGLSQGKIGEVYAYNFESMDPDGDEIYYVIDWGDGSQHVRIGPKATGTEIQADHTWTVEGGYVIKAKATDTNGASSEWSMFNIMMPKSRVLNRNIFNNAFIRSLFSKFFSF